MIPSGYGANYEKNAVNYEKNAVNYEKNKNPLDFNKKKSILRHNQEAKKWKKIKMIIW